MIPSHWFRRIILIVFIMEVAGGILWVTGKLSTNPASKPMTQALGSLIFLFGFYASAPLSARFLAPRLARDVALQERLGRIVATVPDSRPVFLYDHADKEANTVGLLPSHSRIYVWLPIVSIGCAIMLFFVLWQSTLLVDRIPIIKLASRKVELAVVFPTYVAVVSVFMAAPLFFVVSGFIRL